MKYIIPTLLIIANISFIHAGNTQIKTLKVFICAGQSNMVGKNSISSELPNELKKEQKNLFFDGNSWVALAPDKAEKKGFGPEISFANKLSSLLNEPVGIIKHSKGGTNLSKKWSPKRKKGLYAQLLEKVKSAEVNKKIEIVGMIWMQGEADSKKKEMANSYAKNLSTFIKAARKDFKSPNMIFVSGRVNPLKSKYPHVDDVRKAQEDCDLSQYGYINCDNLEKRTDNLHYTTKGIVEMGNLFAEKMYDKIKIKNK